MLSASISVLDKNNIIMISVLIIDEPNYQSRCYDGNKESYSNGSNVEISSIHSLTTSRVDHSIGSVFLNNSAEVITSDIYAIYGNRMRMLPENHTKFKIAVHFQLVF